jgi:hypothetical protein
VTFEIVSAAKVLAEVMAGRRLPSLPNPQVSAIISPRAPSAPVETVAPMQQTPSSVQADGADRALVFGLWWLMGAVSLTVGIGTVVEFEEGNYIQSVFLAISAASAPISLVTIAVDGWLHSVGRSVWPFGVIRPSAVLAWLDTPIQDLIRRR